MEELEYVRPDLRNPTLAVMFEALLDSENRFSSILTVRREMAFCGLEAPIFENRRGEFVVVLRNSEYVSEITGNASLLRFCESPRTRQEIADFLTCAGFILYDASTCVFFA